MLFTHLPRRIKAILIGQAIGMLMGTSTHLIWVLQNGFLSERYNAPLFTKVFWDSLTILDPLAAFLLILKPKIGVILTLIIITADILHNNIFYFDELYGQSWQILEWIKRYWMILGQLLFALFVFVTFRKNLQAINRAGR